MRLRKGIKGCVGVMLSFFIFPVGCGTKEAKTIEDFTTYAKEQGYTVTDCTEQFAGYGHIDQAVVAKAPDGSYQVEFYDLDSEESACTFYEENHAILSEREEDASSHSSSSTSSAQNYEITARWVLDV